jgi:hypothetical protein
MRGLDPRIHVEVGVGKHRRKFNEAEKPHGLPGQARQ